MNALDIIDEVDAPEGTERVTLDVRDLPPPRPLQDTLERLADLPDDVVLVQVNDRAPQHLYPRLADRGYNYETVERDDRVITLIWDVDLEA